MEFRDTRIRKAFPTLRSWLYFFWFQTQPHVHQVLRQCSQGRLPQPSPLHPPHLFQCQHIQEVFENKGQVPQRQQHCTGVSFFYSWLLFSNSVGAPWIKFTSFWRQRRPQTKMYAASDTIFQQSNQLECGFWGYHSKINGSHKVKAHEIKSQKMASEKLCAFFFESTQEHHQNYGPLLWCDLPRTS